LLYIPTEYSQNKKKWPLMLFLHGAGERGDNMELVKTHGPPKLVEQKKDFPFILVSPQCPKGDRWSSENQLEFLTVLLDEVIKKYRVDVSRIYLTGLSMGGFGTWSLSIKHPNKFAAIVPICGGGNPDNVCEIKHVPTWVFHGAKDQTVLLERSEDMVNALKACDGNVKFTVYPTATHDSWTETYNNPELYDWLLSHKSKN
jgi:predicted peptidase